MKPMEMRFRVVSGVTLLVASLFGVALADEQRVPRVTMPQMKTAPKIDGVIHEEEWRHAVRSIGFVSHRTGALSSRQGVFWLGSDGANVYIAAKTEAPPDGRILTRAVPDGDRDLWAAFLDDSLELVLDPKRDRSEGDRTYYHVITNARRALGDWAVDRPLVNL